MRIWLAIRAAFAVLFNRAAAERVRGALESKGATLADGPRPVPTQPEGQPAAAEPAGPTRRVPQGAITAGTARPAGRSDAMTLISALQREARFLDLVQEPLGEYSDAQIGAAAREVLRNCAAVFERMFAIQPVLSQDEGSDVEVPRGYDPLRYRLVGNVAGEPPFRGRLTHRGWIATRCDLPAWTGGTQAANVIAPVEVELG